MNLGTRPQRRQDIVGGNREIEGRNAQLDVVKARRNFKLSLNGAGVGQMVVHDALGISGGAGGVNCQRRVLHVNFGELGEDLLAFNSLQKRLVNGKISAAVFDNVSHPVLGIFGGKRGISRSRAKNADQGCDIEKTALQDDRVDLFLFRASPQQS